MTYAVERRKSKIVQALGKFNRYIEDKNREKINAWFKDVYILVWLKGMKGNEVSLEAVLSL